MLHIGENLSTLANRLTDCLWTAPSIVVIVCYIHMHLAGSSFKCHVGIVSLHARMGFSPLLFWILRQLDLRQNLCVNG
jgi:hypothetical protein